MLERAGELLDDLTAELQDIRIKVAQRRDGMLTEAEIVAMLDVYAEFGR